MRISDWSSDVCSSDLRKRSDRSGVRGRAQHRDHGECAGRGGKRAAAVGADGAAAGAGGAARGCERRGLMGWALVAAAEPHHRKAWLKRFDPRFWTVDFARPMMASVTSEVSGGAEEHTSELQSHMRN